MDGRSLRISHPLLITVVLGVATITFNMVHNTALETIKTRPDVRYIVLNKTTARIYNYASPVDTVPVSLFVQGSVGGFRITTPDGNQLSSFDAVDFTFLKFLGIEYWPWSYRRVPYEQGLVPVERLGTGYVLDKYSFLEHLRVSFLGLVQRPSMIDQDSTHPMDQILRNAIRQMRIAGPPAILTGDEVRRRALAADREIMNAYANAMRKALPVVSLDPIAFYSDYDSVSGYSEPIGLRMTVSVPRGKDYKVEFIPLTNGLVAQGGQLSVSVPREPTVVASVWGKKNLALRVPDEQELFTARSQTGAIITYYMENWTEVLMLFALIVGMVTLAPLALIIGGFLARWARQKLVTRTVFGVTRVRNWQTISFRSPRPGVFRWNVNEAAMPPATLLNTSSCPNQARTWVEDILRRDVGTGIYEVRVGPFKKAPEVRRINYAIVDLGESAETALASHVEIIAETLGQARLRILGDYLTAVVLCCVSVVVLLGVDQFLLLRERNVALSTAGELMWYVIPAYFVLGLPLGHFFGGAWVFNDVNPRMDRASAGWLLLLVLIGAVGVFLVFDKVVPQANYGYMTTVTAERRDEPFPFSRHLMATASFRPRPGDREMPISQMREKIVDPSVSVYEKRRYETEIWKRYQMAVGSLILSILGVQVGMQLRVIPWRILRRFLAAATAFGIALGGLEVYRWGEDLGDAGRVPPWLAMGLFNILLLGGGVALGTIQWFLARRTRQS